MDRGDAAASWTDAAAAAGPLCVRGPTPRAGPSGSRRRRVVLGRRRGRIRALCRRETLAAPRADMQGDDGQTPAHREGPRVGHVVQRRGGRRRRGAVAWRPGYDLGYATLKSATLERNQPPEPNSGVVAVALSRVEDVSFGYRGRRAPRSSGGGRVRYQPRAKYSECTLYSTRNSPGGWNATQSTILVRSHRRPFFTRSRGPAPTPRPTSRPARASPRGPRASRSGAPPRFPARSSPALPRGRPA